MYLAGRPANLQELTPLWHLWGDGLRAILTGVIVSRYGKGRVVYSASAIESLFLEQNSIPVGCVLRSMGAKAAPEPPLRNAGLLVEALYRKTQTGSMLEVAIPRVEACQGVRVELE